jgi:hypothetical protein
MKSNSEKELNYKHLLALLQVTKESPVKSSSPKNKPHEKRNLDEVHSPFSGDKKLN